MGTSVSQAAKRFALLYVCALVALSLVGAQSRYLYRTHQALIDQKEQLHQTRTYLRAEAERLRSLDTVRAYARSKGMVPTALLLEERQVQPQPAPTAARELPTGLEFKTLWR